MAVVNGDGPSLDWAALVPHTIHPVQVAIIEAMAWVGVPLSATMLKDVFDDADGHYLGIVSYHLSRLAEWGAVAKTGHRPRRGARETFYFLAPSMLRSGA